MNLSIKNILSAQMQNRLLWCLEHDSVGDNAMRETRHEEDEGMSATIYTGRIKRRASRRILTRDTRARWPRTTSAQPEITDMARIKAGPPLAGLGKCSLLLTLMGLLFLSQLASPVLAAAPQLLWSPPTTLDDSSPNQIAAVACASETQCTAVDDTGQEMTFNPASIGSPSPVRILSLPETAESALSCSSETQCTEVISNYAITFNPQSPGTPTPVNLPARSSTVSCPTASQCTALIEPEEEVTFNPKTGVFDLPAKFGERVDGSSIACSSATQCSAVSESLGANEVTFNPQAPKEEKPAEVDYGGQLFAITCLSETRCITTDGENEVTFNPKSPSGAQRAYLSVSSRPGRGGHPASLSCVSTTECFAASDSGVEASFNPETGAATTKTIDTSEALLAISCPSAAVCVTVDSNSGEFTFEPASSSAPTERLIDSENAPSEIGSISCPSATQCTEIDNAGGEVTFNPHSPAKTGATELDPEVNTEYEELGLEISCPSTTQCTAIDAMGREITFNPESPGSPSPVPIDNKVSQGHVFLTSLACPSLTRCAAGDSEGNEIAFNPQSPATPTPKPLDAKGIGRISCPSEEQCTALDYEGYEVTFNPVTPGTPTPVSVITTGAAATSIACPSTSQCTAIEFEGNGVTFNPKSPGMPTIFQIERFAYDMDQVVCPSTSVCASLDTDGASYTFNPTAPSPVEEARVDEATTIVDTIACPETTFCVAGDAFGHVYTSKEGHLPANTELPSVTGTKGGESGGGTSMATTAQQVVTPTNPITAPVVGQRQTVSPVSGPVMVRLRGTSRFVALSTTRSIPDGSEVDATNGRVLVTVATRAGTETAEAYGGRFVVRQDHSGGQEAHFVLSLPLSGCPGVALPRGSAAAASRAKRGPKSRHLWVSEHGGSWGTTGRYVSTTVEGTRWLTKDECNRSEVQVAAGKVKVHDLIHNETKVLTADQHYTAAAKRR